MKKVHLLLILIFLSINLNAQDTWTELKTNFPGWLKSVSFPSTTVGYSVGVAGYILKTTDAGNSWAASYLQDYSNLYSVNFINVNTGFMVSEGAKSRARIYKTTDGGNTWNIKAYADSSIFYKIKFFGSSLGFMIGATPYGPILAKTTDQGETWSLSTITTGQPLGITFESNGIQGWYVGVNGIIFSSISSGSSWSPQISPTLEHLEAIQSVTNKIVFACGAKGTVIKTTNGGSTWTLLNTGFTDDLYDLRFNDENEGWVVGGSTTDIGKIYKTTDGGKSWIKQYTNDSTNNFYSVSFPNNELGWVAGDKGRIIKYTSSPSHIITTGSIATTKYCKGSSITVPFIIKGNFNQGNKFNLILSDENGSFANSRIIGSVDQLTSGSINGIIPDTITESKGLTYKVKISSTDPPVNGSISSISIGIYSIPEIGSFNGGGIFCKDDSEALIKFHGIDTNMRYVVYINDNESGIMKFSLSNGAIPISISGTYKLKAINPNNPNCFKWFNDSATFTIKPSPELPIITYSNNTLKSNYETGNQWYFNNLILKDSVNQILYPDKEGIYSVVVTKDEFPSEPAFYKYTNNSVNDFISEFSISPNPASDYIEINEGTHCNVSLPEKIEIFNIFGEKVEQTFLSVQSGQTGMYDPLKIKVSNLPAGVYFIKIGDKFEKFVKM